MCAISWIFTRLTLSMTPRTCKWVLSFIAYFQHSLSVSLGTALIKKMHFGGMRSFGGMTENYSRGISSEMQHLAKSFSLKCFDRNLSLGRSMKVLYLYVCVCIHIVHALALGGWRWERKRKERNNDFSTLTKGYWGTLYYETNNSLLMNFNYDYNYRALLNHVKSPGLCPKYIPSTEAFLNASTVIIQELNQFVKWYQLLLVVR